MQGFMSYAHRDADRVERLRRQLHPVARVRGVSLWIDERIHAGHHWDHTIKQALAGSLAAASAVASPVNGPCPNSICFTSTVMVSSVPIRTKALVLTVRI
jgi:hypothetical protein